MPEQVTITLHSADSDGRLSAELVNVVRLPSPYRLAQDYARQVYDATGRNMSASARIMGMHRRSLQRMLQLGGRP